MNKPVSLELKQLLYNKGWRYELSDDISETSSLYNNHSLAEERFNQNDISYVDITIADIIMWLYDKHGIWIGVELTDNTKEFYFQPTIWTMKDRDYNDEDMEVYVKANDEDYTIELSGDEDEHYPRKWYNLLLDIREIYKGE